MNTHLEQPTFGNRFAYHRALLFLALAASLVFLAMMSSTAKAAVMDRQTETVSANIILPDCGTLPICDYLRMHSMDTGTVQLSFALVIQPECGSLPFCAYIQAHNLAQGVQYVMTPGLPVTGK